MRDEDHISALKGRLVKPAALNWEGLFLIALSLVLTLMPVVVPGKGLFLTTFTSFPLVVLAVKYPWRYTVRLAGFEAACTLIIGGFQSLIFFSQYGFVPVVMAWAIRRRCVVAQTMLWSVGVPLGVGSFFFVTYGLFINQTPYQLLVSYLEQVAETFLEQLQVLEQSQGLDRAGFETFSHMLSQFVLTVFPAFLVINHLITNVVNYALARYYCYRSRPSVCLDPADFALWRCSDHLIWIFLASGVAMLLPIAPISAVALNIFIVTLTIYLLQGIAIAVFWSRRTPFSFRMRLLLTLVLFLLIGPLCVMLCMAAGLFDLWIDFRHLRRQPLSS
ncbi:MAG: DUF2232 domain-containing protein [bacterium]|nr:DUF2232 domain-containing protein [bacterium]